MERINPAVKTAAFLLLGLVLSFNGSIVANLLLIVLGLLFLFLAPGSKKRALSIGAVTLIYGVVRIVAFVRDGGEASGRFDLFVGVLLAALGIFLLVCPQVIVSLIPIALGIYIIVDSVSAVKKALDLKALGFEHWWVSFLVALALLILGAVMVVRPLAAASVPVVFIGIVFLFDGVSTLANTVVADRVFRN